MPDVSSEIGNSHHPRAALLPHHRPVEPDDDVPEEGVTRYNENYSTQTVLVPDDHSRQIACFAPFTVTTKSDAASPLMVVLTNRKGLSMDVRFLRDEAARFRGMAEDTDREASRIRFLAMAADYEARSRAAGEMVKPIAEEAGNELIAPEAEREEMPVASLAVDGPLSLRPVRIRKETVIVGRRSVGRPRRE